MKRLNALGELTDKTKLNIKPNIKGKITKAKRNYTPDDIDGLDPLFPEEMGVEFSGLKQNRVRYTDISEFPDRLPTSDLTPYPIDEDEFIGQHESPKNIYLTIAFAFNKAMEKIEKLEEEVKKLKEL